MRDLNFIAPWYPAYLRRRRLLRLQSAVCGGLVLAAAIYAGATAYELYSTKRVAAATRDALTRKRLEVSQLDELLVLQNELMAKQKLIGQIGVPLELSRLISDLVNRLPDGMSLIQLDVTTDERARNIVEIARTPGKTDPPVQFTRKLQVRIKGLAPSDGDVMKYYSAVSQFRPFENTQLGATSEYKFEHRAGRQFEMSFEVPLDYSAASVAQVTP